MSPGSPAADAIVATYMADVASRYYGRTATPEEVDRALRDEPYDDLRSATGVFLAAIENGNPVACAGARFANEIAELTKVFTLPSNRGKGLGRRLLIELEEICRGEGIRTIRIDTRSDLVEACALYESLGFLRVDAFNGGHYSDLWYAKTL